MTAIAVVPTTSAQSIERRGLRRTGRPVVATARWTTPRPIIR